MNTFTAVVRPPIILATLAVIVSFVPMFFITGMMGPYMRPMALNVPLAMLMSLLVAFTITPWMCYHVLKGQRHDGEEARSDEGEGSGELHEADDVGTRQLRASLTYRIYAAAVRPLLGSRLMAWGLIAAMAVLFVLSRLLAATGRVPLKMLPFDNKNELQVVIDMPEGTTLEATAAAAHDLARYLQTVNEVTDVTTYVGTASPMDFNGLVRHYYLRAGANVADIRVNLIDKDHRTHQSHELALRLRDDLGAIASRHGANIKIVESPPGPPVISTVTVEVYGRPYHDYADLQRVARTVERRFHQEPGVVDIDTTVEAKQTKWVFVTDKEKAALAGLSTRDVAQALATALGGENVTVLHDESEVNPTPVNLRLPRAGRSSIARLSNLYLTTRADTSGGGAGASGDGVIQLGEIGRFVETVRDQTIYHKNLQPVVYVLAEMAGRAPAILNMQGYLAPGAKPVLRGIVSQRVIFPGEDPPAPYTVPADFSIVWTGEGEWKITVDVFRDLGIAFAAACLGIYMLLVYETRSYFMPLILMISIPLTVIGIMPGFWLLNLFMDRPVGGYDNPVFFTATAMIGMIALSGIAVRNAILLIDFMHAAQAKGVTLRQAILDSGAVRFRPIFLTAGTAMLAAIPITLDPIFSGLAWALIFGLFVSTTFTLLLIPVVYWLLYGRAERGAVR